MNIDLHCHSTASDGLLTPTELVALAALRGVTTLALTDHDEVSGLAEARLAAAGTGMEFIDGVEISVTWEDTTLHIVGLCIDPAHRVLAEGLANVRGGRGRRARLIAEDLERIGISGSLEGALAYAGNPELVSRTHFARFLVERGHARDTHAVFQNYLVHGRPGYAPHVWPGVDQAVAWIRAAGGIAVLAHPGRYRLSHADMRRLLAEFRDSGGQAIEVVTSSHTKGQFAEFARYAREFGLHASRGSDFHGPGESSVEPGGVPPLAADLKPVWRLWQER